MRRRWRPSWLSFVTISTSAVSPTTGAEADYSLFRPRGHYTRTPELTRYFLAMSSLGQTGFLLCEPEQVRTGLMLARAITGSDDLTRLWTQIYEPTAFLVGLADDFTPAEMAAAADAVDADWRESPEVIDDSFVADLVAELSSLRQVAIDPERASMRVMGARFVLDSFILDQLVFPNVANYEGDPRWAGSKVRRSTWPPPLAANGPTSVRWKPGSPPSIPTTTRNWRR
jgi:hypothetical protein